MTRQVTLSKLFLVTFIYAAALALLASCNVPILQQALAMSVLSVFVAADLCMIGLQRNKNSSVLWSYYATAFAFGALGCLIGVLFEPPSAPAPTTGFDLKSAIAPLVRIFGVIVMYFMSFAVFSSTAFVISLFSLRRSRLARWLLLMNFPGTAIFVSVAVGECCSG
jgi:hypothetical protein